MSRYVDRDDRIEGVIYLVIGIGLFVGGIAMLAENSTKIYLGAIVCGPYVAYRGWCRMRYGWMETPASSDSECGTDAANPAGVSPLLTKSLFGPQEVTCESCRQQYFYDPKKSEDSLKQFVDTACSVAPCPRCGWIQSHMVPVARRYGPAAYLVAGVLALFAGVGLFAFGVNDNTSGLPMHTYYIGVGFLAVLGFGLIMLGSYRNKRWDPNSQALAKRLKLAETICLTKEEYDERVEIEARILAESLQEEEEGA